MVKIGRYCGWLESQRWAGVKLVRCKSFNHQITTFTVASYSSPRLLGRLKGVQTSATVSEVKKHSSVYLPDSTTNGAVARSVG
jgi:hypothetical protein